MRKIDKIVVHCAATKPGMNIGVSTIRRWHVEERGWRDVGYHYVIKRDGTIQQGRDDEVPGAHAKGHNKHSLGICLVGGMDKDGNAAVNYTRIQWQALRILVTGLSAQYPAARVCGHNELTRSKTCPNFNVPEWYDKSLATPGR